MKAQHALGINLSWLRATIIFLIDVCILSVCDQWHADEEVGHYLWWTGIGITVVVSLFGMTTYRRVPLDQIWATWIRDQIIDPTKALLKQKVVSLNHQRPYSRDRVGIRESRGRLVSVIEVSRPPHTPVSQQDDVHMGLSLSVVETGLRQFDVRLESIDIVSIKNTDNDTRSCWIVLRINPQDNVHAVATRDSLASTFAAATERLAHTLDNRFICTKIATAEDFDHIDDVLRAGLEPNQVRRRLFEKQQSYITSFWVSPRDIITDNLEELWFPHMNTTVVTVRLLASRNRRTEVAVLARYHSMEKLDKSVTGLLNRFVGRCQIEAIAASLPLPQLQGPMRVPGKILQQDEDIIIAIDSSHEHALSKKVTSNG